MFNKICFFHNHVNGDCFLSRILVKQIIDYTKDNNIVYYYTAPRAIISYCLDLGIPDEYFNVIPVLYSEYLYYIQDNILFINVWIGITTPIVEELNPICGMCLNNIIPKYNFLINKINYNLNMNINLINTDPKLSPYIPINDKFYDYDFIKNFIKKSKENYEKFVLVCNNSPTTFISMIDISKLYLYDITNKFPKYLFITFQTENFIQHNLISIKEIYTKTNTHISHDWGIMFTLLSKLCDKVILLPTGPSLTCFNNEIIGNKFIMLFDYSNSGNPSNCKYCNNDKHKFCTNRFGWDITLIDVDYTDAHIKNKICNYLEDFLKIN